MPKKSTSQKKNIRTIACKHLVSLNQISNVGNPLCYCDKRDFNLSPYNIVCQICELYKPNPQDITHADMYVADDAKEFVFNFEEIDIIEEDTDGDFEEDSEEEVEEEEEEEEAPAKKKKKKKSKKKVSEEAEEAEEIEVEPEEEGEEEEEDDDEDFEIEKPEEEEEEEELVIGLEKEEDEEELDYEDEREEGLGKKHGILGKDDEEEEDEELEDELDEIDEEFEAGEEDLDTEDDTGDEVEDIDDSDIDSGDSISSDFDFETEVIAKIKTIGEGDDKKEICPYCQKSKVSVLRHISKCKRAPAEAIKAYETYKNTKKKSSGKSK